MRKEGWKEGRTDGQKEGNVLFNDTLNTFYLRLYGVGHMVKDQSDRGREENPLPPLYGLLIFSITSIYVCIYVAYNRK